MSHVFGGYLVVSLTDDRIILMSERKAVFVVRRKLKRHHRISDDPSLSTIYTATWYHLVIAEHVESHVTNMNSTLSNNEYIRFKERKSFASIDHYFNNTVHYAHPQSYLLNS